MAGVRQCRVCGKDYPYCKTDRPQGLFRWQDVACCPEHGAVYFAQIAESRGETGGIVKDSIPKKDENITESCEYLGYVEPDDEDGFYDDGFDDSEDEIEIEIE